MKKINILIADDHELILDGVSFFLGKEVDFVVLGSAKNGYEVLDFLHTSPVDIVILDIHMPILDGIETSKIIKKKFPNTKIILLTMEGDGQFILQAMRLGIHGYVLKEKSKEVLITAINSVANGSSYWSPDLLPRIADAQLLYPVEAEKINFTTSELQVICTMINRPSFTAKEVADELRLAVLTVNTHLRNARQKLKVTKTLEVVKYVIERNLCETLSPLHQKL